MLFRSGMGTSISNFGQRQLHGLTGWAPKGGLKAIGGGSADAEARLFAATKGANPEDAKGWKEFLGAHEALRAHQKAENMGLTNLPGLARSAVKDPLGTAKATWDAQMKGTSAGTKALMLGLPAVGLASAVHGETPEGQTKGQNIGYQAGQIVGGIAGSAIPIVGSMAAGEAVGRVGKAIGGGIDKLRGARPHGAPSLKPFAAESADLTQAPAQSTPSETIMTSRASGGGGEGYG